MRGRKGLSLKKGIKGKRKKSSLSAKKGPVSTGVPQETDAERVLQVKDLLEGTVCEP
jgi:hypothetical protein